MSRRQEISVFDYLDARAFLRDFYVAKKRSMRGFSYRTFSRLAGLKSPNYLKLVIDGERNLSEVMAAKFAKGCGLGAEQSEYFINLVLFTQASTSKERNQHYQKLLGSRSYRKAQKLDLAHATYHSTWYLPAIRELVASSDFVEDPEWIADKLSPAIHTKEVEKALSVLLELELLCRDANGKLIQSSELVSTGAETRGLHIATYHRMMMERASSSIDEFIAAERDISSLTLGVSGEGLRKLKARVQRFRQELLELSATEDDIEQIIQLNFQLFPLTRGVK